MINSLLTFLHMNGYAWYIWPAYAAVCGSLFLQWLFSWRRWQQCKEKHTHE